ncbi:hypothetical protein PYCCODRAFT_1466540 [Trametes coccinea BRFM310]|uniref:F-box domain-containing protein n=1 Tax=Trametes coccinea (strain BRFM310) TaxID=1353009 RepID=A0A1Y2ISN5_TRAC3|nr:hypothetical protein PYCCODRAFT_1466540 [Trametes coccinea BRFM310]
MATSATTHRALSNVDVLTEIIGCFEFAYFHGVDPTYEANHVQPAATGIESDDEIFEIEVQRKRTLAQLARVCKAFREPALSLLWRQLHSLFPLLRLLPSLSMVEEQVIMECRYGAIPRNIYQLPLDMPDEDWGRLTSYAAYVQKLYHTQPAHRRPRDITAQTWTLILREFSNRPLLPNLRVLKWDAEEVDTEFAAITAFLPPSLKSLSIGCIARPSWHVDPSELKHAWKTQLNNLISELPNRVPQLSSISISCGIIDPNYIVQTLSLNQPCSLRAMALSAPHDAPPLNLCALKAVARFTTVESLDFALQIAKMPRAELPARLELDGLVSFLLNPIGGPGIGINPAYEVFSSANLRKLHLNNVRYTGDAALRRMSTAWARSFPRLEVFRLWIAYADMQPLPEPQSSLSDVLGPLLGIGTIREFNVDLCWIPLVVGDSDLTAFAEAWPALGKLRIALAAHDPSCYQTGVLGLLALSAHCPRLASLDLNRLVFGPEDVGQLPPVASSPPHQLRSLQVVYGILPETYHLVRERIFPNLNMTIYEDKYYN